MIDNVCGCIPSSVWEQCFELNDCKLSRVRIFATFVKLAGRGWPAFANAHTVLVRACDLKSFRWSSEMMCSATFSKRAGCNTPAFACAHMCWSAPVTWSRSDDQVKRYDLPLSHTVEDVTPQLLHMHKQCWKEPAGQTPRGDQVKRYDPQLSQKVEDETPQLFRMTKPYFLDSVNWIHSSCQVKSYGLPLS